MNNIEKKNFILALILYIIGILIFILTASLIYMSFN
jgi:hypothetical protein